MLKKTILAIAFLAAVGISRAGSLLEGYRYGHVQAPTGQEWQSPGELSLNKLQPHAWFMTFGKADNAKYVLPEHSDYYQSLNGKWKFHFAKNPDERPKEFFEANYDVSHWDNIEVPGSWNIQGIQKDGSLKYGVPIYVNQPVIFMHKVAVDDWRQGVMRTRPRTGRPIPIVTKWALTDATSTYHRIGMDAKCFSPSMASTPSSTCG